MPVIQLTRDNLDATIENNDTVIIDFWASWCGPCMAFKPIFEKAAENHPDIAFASCNTEEQMELATMFQVRSIPTLFVFREQIPVFGQPGMLPEEMLEDLIRQVKGLDMEQVRAEVEKQKATATA